MEQKFVQIHQCLQKLIGLHRQLLELVRQEREALVAADLNRIQECVFGKEALLDQLRSEEAARMKVIAELSVMMRKPIAELTLTRLILDAQGIRMDLSEQLRSSFNMLQVLIQRITEQNAQNGALVEKSLSHVDQMKQNVLGETVPAATTYGSSGKRVNRSTSGARLISQEA